MDLVDRLFRRLHEAAAREHPASPNPSFTIAEVYQRLVPYRGVRGELGILELAEYEHALLRLLSGERGYLRAETPEVEEELRRELASPSPILGIYRDYAAVRVELAPPAEAPALPERPAAPPAPPPAPPRAAPGSCRRCRGALPDEPELRFCPHCGADQRETTCAGCALPLKPGWSFCIRCGAARTPA